MRNRSCFAALAVILSQFSAASASLFSHSEAVGMACAIAAQDLFTTCNQEDYACFCESSLYVYAVETCIGRETHFNSTKMGQAFDKFETRFCETHNAHANGSDAWNVENQKLNPVVTQRSYQIAYESEKNNMSQKQVSVWLGIGLILYWAAVIGIVFFGRILQAIFVRLFAYRMVMRRPSKLERLLQSKVFWPALFNRRHLSNYEFFRGWLSFSLPTRFESLVVSIYILLALIFMLTPYTFMNNDPLFQSRWKEMMRYASDRSGIMATMQFPMLILFALRNNILIYFSGWSYSTFNTYHRATARVTYILLIVHAVIKHIFSASYGGSLVKYYYPVPYFRWGCAAMGLFSLMIMFAMLRNRCYEVFYRLHQAMAIGGIICSIFHLNGIGFKEPLWAAIALWGADWTIRVGRIFLFNINIFFPPLPGSHRATYATARVYEGEMIKLTVRTPVRWVCSPGQYVFVHTNRWTLVGGHPFSVVGASDTGDGLELLVKARTGMTRRLHNALDDRSCSPVYPITIPMYVEGPYGHSAPVNKYEEGLFFAGGIGITGVLGYLETMSKSVKSSSVPKKVRLFWAIRSRSDVDPVVDRLARLKQSPGVYIHIYQRQPNLTTLAAVETAATPTPTSAPPSPFDQHTLHEIDLKGPEIVVRPEEDPHTAMLGSFHKERQQASEEKCVMYLPQQVDKHDNASFPTSPNNNNLTVPRHTRSFSASSMKRPSEIRNSIVGFVKARNPEDDDQFDYGYKGRVAKKRASMYYEKAEKAESRTNTEDIGRRPLSQYPPPSSRRSSASSTIALPRSHIPDLIDAGFTDTFAERRMSMLNPFDEKLYGYTSKLDTMENDQEHSYDFREVYNLIEPVGMDITALVKYHLKNSEGSVCVVGCGPDRMMDTLCWSCCEFLEVAKSRVDYYEEAFKW